MEATRHERPVNKPVKIGPTRTVKTGEWPGTRRNSVWDDSGPSKRKEVMNAIAMNTPTETKDLLLRRDIPQMPWPDVHPLRSLVPNPTRRPPMPYPSLETTGGRCMAELAIAGSARNSTAVRRNELMNANFHSIAGSVRAFLGSSNVVEVIPLAPRMSPLKRSKTAADRPIRLPPRSPSTGVKKLDMIFAMLLFCSKLSSFLKMKTFVVALYVFYIPALLYFVSITCYF
jgi:hypothetical protein